MDEIHDKSKDAIGNLSGDPPACGAVPQPTTPPRAAASFFLR